MITSSLRAEGMRVWVATPPVDMRTVFDGLAEVVRTLLGREPRSGSLFVFRNRSSQRFKLWYDRDGLAISYRKLDRGGTFPFLAGCEKAVAIDAGQLLRRLSGMTPAATRTD